MNIIVVGAEETGYYIAAEFSHEDGINVTLIDQNETLLKEAQNSLNIATFKGQGTNENILLEAGIENADCLIACSDHDESNIISCILAKRYQVKKTIALAHSRFYRPHDVIVRYKKSGVDHIINRSQLIAKEILDTCKINASVSEVASFVENRAIMVGCKINEKSPLLNVMLKDLPPDNFFLVGCIIRDRVSLIPKGDDQLRLNDHVYLLLPTDALNKLNRFLKANFDHSRKAIIFGEPQPVYEIANGLMENGYSVTIVGEDAFRIEQIKANLSNHELSKLVCANILKVKTQLKIDVPNATFFIALHEKEKINIVSSLIARSLGTKKTIIRAENSDNLVVAEVVGTDAKISTRLLTIRHIRKIIHETKKADFITIADTNMEALSLSVSERAKIIDKPLKDLKFPEQALIGMIIRKNYVSIASGNSRLFPNDKVIIFTPSTNVDKFTNMMDP